MRSALRRVTAPFALILALTLAATSVVEAGHAWGSYHWARAANPFTLELGDNVDGNWQQHLDKTSTDWNSPQTAAQVNGDETTLDGQPWTGPAVLTTVITTGKTNPRNCRASALTVQVCNAKYGRNGWLGLAQIWISGGHIVQGVAKVNDTYFSQSLYNTWAEKQHVMCQEVAHTFGLGHTSENGSSQNSCMDYFSNTGANADDLRSTEPNYHDFEQLDAIYSGHVESGAAGANTSGQHGFAPVWVGGAAEDGTPQGASPARGRYYVQDVGAGRLLITHVYWTNGHDRN